MTARTLKNTEFYIPHFGPAVATFLTFPSLPFRLGAVSKFQLSTSSGSGLAFVENHANFHIYWGHHLVSYSSGFRMVFSVLESP
jgi:hypothetical protein